MNEFDRLEDLGSEALKQLKMMYPNDKILKYDITFTPKGHPYDAIIIVSDEYGKVQKRVWIEIKIRDRIFDTYMLETKKLNSLINLRNELGFLTFEVVFLYVNFTPEGTFIWDITKANEEETSTIYANKATALSRTNKVNKSVIMLDPKDQKKVKRYDYIFDEKKLREAIKIDKKVEEVRIAKKREIGFYI